MAANFGRIPIFSFSLAQWRGGGSLLDGIATGAVGRIDDQDQDVPFCRPEGANAEAVVGSGFHPGNFGQGGAHLPARGDGKSGWDFEGSGVERFAGSFSDLESGELCASRGAG